MVSIIIPARNEAANLPILFESIASLDSAVKYEVILIDDQSEDDTYKVAESFKSRIPLNLLSSEPLPEGWIAKQWALHQAQKLARGDYLLFIDADISLYPSALKDGLSFMQSQNADMISALPFHRCLQAWEKILAPFHYLILLGTAPYQKPGLNRLFSVGQFLMFKTSAYVAMGGHESVKASLQEDIDLAKRALVLHRRYLVYARPDLFSVRMYADFISFYRGWKRLIRIGVKHASKLASFEVFAVVFALVQISLLFTRPLEAVFGVLLLIQMFTLQKQTGEFSFWGVIFWPFAIGLFMLISLAAMVEQLAAKPLVWKGRAYKLR